MFTNKLDIVQANQAWAKFLKIKPLELKQSTSQILLKI